MHLLHGDSTAEPSNDRLNLTVGFSCFQTHLILSNPFVLAWHSHVFFQFSWHNCGAKRKNPLHVDPLSLHKAFVELYNYTIMYVFPLLLGSS